MSKEVSVSIRAALDSSFRATFQTADQRVRELNSSLRNMKQTAAEMRGLSKAKEDVASLTSKLAEQNTQLLAIQASREEAAAALKAFDVRIAGAAEAAKVAKEQLKQFNAEIYRQKTAIGAAKQPSAEHIAQLERLRKKMRETDGNRTDAGRELTSANRSFDGKVQHIDRLNEKLKQHYAALNTAAAATRAARETHRRLQEEYGREHAALTSLSSPTVQQVTAVKNLRTQVDTAAKALADAEREEQRLGRAIETSQGQIAEATSGLSKYEARLESARAAAAKAAAEHDHYAATVERQRLAMSGQVNSEQAAALSALEASRDRASADHDAARKELASATLEKKAHRKATIEAEQSLEQFVAKERELAGTLKVTQGQIRAATAAVDRHSESLRKQGHDVDNLTDAQKRHNKELERQQITAARNQMTNDLRERSRDLRSQAMTHMYFTLGSGFLFTSPIRDAVEFEKSMIRVKAMSGATSAEFSKLRDEARRLGAETIYTANEVAGAYNELATAGYRPAEMITMMPSMLALANSSMTSLARTAEITSEVLQGFKIDVSDMERVGDALTAAYSSSASSLESLGEMLKYVASVSVDVNSSLEETLAASSVLHNAGIKGSMAGTGLRAMFLRLSDPPAKLRKMLKEMNVDVKDSAGNMRNWIDILHDINKALEGTGTAAKAAAWKKLAGEEHATTASNLAGAEKSGALQLSVKTLRMAPAFNGISEKLLAMPDAELQKFASGMGVKLNKVMSGGGIALAIAGSLKELKGKDFDDKMGEIFQGLKITPSLGDIKQTELDKSSKAAQDALKKLRINPLKAMGGEKSNEELTREIKEQIQMLPMPERLEYVETFFSKTRTGIQGLFKEFSKGGKDMSQLLKALDETLNMKKAEKSFNESTAMAIEQVTGDFKDLKISLGNAVIPALRDLLSFLKPITEAMAKWFEHHQGWAKILMGVVGSLFAFSAAMAVTKLALSGFVNLKYIRIKHFGKGTLGGKMLKGAGKGLGWVAGKIKGGLLASGPMLKSFFGSIMGLARSAAVALLSMGPVGWAITAAIVALAAAGYYLWKHWDTLGPKVKKIWGGIKDFFFDLWGRIIKFVKSAWDWMKEYMGWHPVVYIAKNWEKLVDMFRWVYGKIKPYIKMLFPGDGDVKITGPDEPGFLSRVVDSGKDALSGMGNFFGSGPGTPKISEAPSMPMTERVSSKGSFSQRNTITVNADIRVEAGNSSPMQVAGRIKQEIQTAFRNVPTFDLFDPVEVS